MKTSATHLTTDELEAGLADVGDSPQAAGELCAIFIRAVENQRQSLAAAQLSLEQGIEGDRWVHQHWQTLPDGRSDPRSQVSLMNARFLRQISAGDQEAMSLAGDNLIVDLDLGEENVLDGTRLQIGESVVIEVSAVPHTACAKFAERYGTAAQRFINSQHGRSLNLRGRLARIVVGGRINVGDVVAKQ